MAPPAESLPLQAGPQLLSLCFNWALLGILNIQVYSYYDYFPDDRPSLKCLVYGMLIYEWVQTGLITAVGMDIYVYAYGDVSTITGAHNGWFSVPIMDGIVATVVQTFFAWRIYRLSRMRLFKSRLLAGSIVVLAIIQAIASIIGGAMQESVMNATAIQSHTMRYPFAVWLGAGVLADATIAVSMTILLFKSKVGVARSDAVVNRVIRLVVETGTLTASMAIITIILANLHPLRETLLYETPAVNLTKIYANTFLVNLNSRADLRRRVAETLSLNDLRFTFSQQVIPGNISLGQAGNASIVQQGRTLYSGTSDAAIAVGKGQGVVRTDIRSERRRYSIV